MNICYKLLQVGNLKDFTANGLRTYLHPASFLKVFALGHSHKQHSPVILPAWYYNLKEIFLITLNKYKLHLSTFVLIT